VADDDKMISSDEECTMTSLKASLSRDTSGRFASVQRSNSFSSVGSSSVASSLARSSSLLSGLDGKQKSFVRGNSFSNDVGEKPRRMDSLRSVVEEDDEEAPVPIPVRANKVYHFTWKPA
jgi:hypothetical protein